MTHKEYRCPDCGNYCKKSPVSDKAFCVAHGWFPIHDAAHVTGRTI